VPGGDLLDQRAHLNGDLVALAFPLPFRNQVHLEVRLVRRAAEEVVPDQPVEVVGGRRAGVDLVVLHLGDAGEDGADLPRHAGGLFEGRPLRHVDDDLELALVVERQHLERYSLRDHQPHGEDEEHGHHPEGTPAQTPRADQGGHEVVVDLVEAGFFEHEGLLVGFVVFPPEHVKGQPGGDREGNQEAHEHGDRYVQGHGRHVGTHHAGDEKHGDKGDDHGQRRQDDRRPHLVHRAHHRLSGRFLAHGEMAMDVFHVHNGIIHHQAE